MCAGSVAGGGKLEATGQLGGGHAPRQLQQGERVATGLGDDPVADAAVEPAGDDARQQRARILLAQPFEVELGQAVEVVGRPIGPASRTATTIATDSARTRRATKPRTWLEAASSHCASSTRQSSGRSSATADNRPSTANPTRNRSGTSPARRPKATLRASRCGARKRVEPVEHRRAELMDPGERQLHLRLHARELRDPEAGAWRAA